MRHGMLEHCACQGGVGPSWRQQSQDPASDWPMQHPMCVKGEGRGGTATARIMIGCKPASCRGAGM